MHRSFGCMENQGAAQSIVFVADPLCMMIKYAFNGIKQMQTDQIKILHNTKEWPTSLSADRQSRYIFLKSILTHNSDSRTCAMRKEKRSTKNNPATRQGACDTVQDHGLLVDKETRNNSYAKALPPSSTLHRVMQSSHHVYSISTHRKPSLFKRKRTRSPRSPNNVLL